MLLVFFPPRTKITCILGLYFHSDTFIPLSLLSLCSFGYFMFFLNILFYIINLFYSLWGTLYCLYFLFIFFFNFIPDYGPISEFSNFLKKIFWVLQFLICFYIFLNAFLSTFNLGWGVMYYSFLLLHECSFGKVFTSSKLLLLFSVFFLYSFVWTEVTTSFRDDLSAGTSK